MSGIARQATGSDAAEQPAGWSGEDSGWSGVTGAGATVLQRLGSAVSKVPNWPKSPLLHSVDGHLPGSPGCLVGPPTVLLILCCCTEELGARGYEDRAAEEGQGADHSYRQTELAAQASSTITPIPRRTRRTANTQTTSRAGSAARPVTVRTQL